MSKIENPYPMDSKWIRIVVNAIKNGLANDVLPHFKNLNPLDYSAVCTAFEQSRILNVSGLISSAQSFTQKAKISARKKLAEEKAKAAQKQLEDVLQSDLMEKAKNDNDLEKSKLDRQSKKEEKSLKSPAKKAKHDPLSAAADEEEMSDEEDDVGHDPSLVEHEAHKLKYDAALSELTEANARVSRRDHDISILRSQLVRRTDMLKEANEKLLENNIDPVFAVESQQISFECESQVDVLEES